MSWLKEKLFGKKSRTGSCHLDEEEDEWQCNSDSYNKSQLKAFIQGRQRIDVKIIGYDLRSSEKYVVYKIAVGALGQDYTIDRRYSEFKDIHEHYLKIFPEYNFTNFPGNPSSN